MALTNSAEKPDDDLEGFGVLVEKHQGAIRGFVTARIHDPFEAQDLAQEVFLVAYRKLPQMDTSRPIRPWLFGIATNLVRNHRRKRRATPVGGSNEAILDLLDAEVEALPRNWRETAIGEALEICLAKLGEAARNLIRQRYEEGLGIAEIRGMSGGKHSAITMKLHRIREQLRGCIEGQMKEADYG